ncbi:hypothetical protein [Peribacillus loiseleuriae]|uniref:hypothetical protein n=1 Tax=Peribacillus loiseleuriae TaxID=1679170 RepID=UPI00069D9AB8|nr:hypothetical protein [Peribacillus loiseleuriae]
MKGFLKLFMGLFLAFTLTGCIGEEYDFTPPTVTISTTIDSINEQSLFSRSILFVRRKDKQDWFSLLSRKQRHGMVRADPACHDERSR